MELTDAIRDYVEEKLQSLERFAKRFQPCDVAVEIGRTSEKQNKGDVYFAEFMVTIPGEPIRVRNEMDDLYAAIDESKDDLKREFVERKEMMMEKRGAGDEAQGVGAEGEMSDDEDDDELFMGADDDDELGDDDSEE